MKRALWWLSLPFAALAATDFETQVRPILKANCAGCHSGPSGQGGLDLTGPPSILKGGKSGAAIKPGAAGDSLLIARVVARTMPPGNMRKLTDAEIATLRSWVDAQTPQVAAVTEKDVVPVFQMRCVVCHGKRKQEGGLDLRTRASILKGGKSGPAIVPGKPAESLLLKRINLGEMPPPKLFAEASVRQPSSQEVEAIERWVAAGAAPALPADPVEAAKAESLVTDKDRAFWSFQPPRQPPVPSVRGSRHVRNPIDAFLLAKLESNGKSLSTEAARGVLLRRVYLDVVGFPPTVAETEAFLNDQRPDAYERVVDRLLESSNYGERWGKFWLDAAGYSDSEGIIDEDRIRPNAWRYRDAVIRAFNAGKPYDRFLTEQLAGDELIDYKNSREVTGEVVDIIASTAFLRLAPDGTYSPANGSVAERMNVIADEVEVLGSSVLGLTVNCARCHNHKYDPIPQRDYYRLSAILHTAFDPYDWVKPTERNLDVAIASERREAEAHNGPLERAIKRLETEIGVKLKEKAEVEGLRKQVAELRKNLKPKPDLRALYDMGGTPSPSYLLRRGDAQLIGDEMQPGVPSVLRVGLQPYSIQPPRPDTSGRRLALAKWLTQPDHPLTARVMVNRVWMHHFGKGIVASPANFGRTGVPPTHPELLDWLATDFVGNGWRAKRLHRLILTSAAYRQQSGPAADDGLLAHRNVRRMDAEQLRDSILRVTDRLDFRQFGPPVQVETKPGGEVVGKGEKTGFRRSVYLLQRRTTPETQLEAFDLPPMSPNCIERATSNVATQALQLTNSETIRSHARYLAARLIDRHGERLAGAIEELYLRALSRRPEPAEIQRALATLRTLEQHWSSHLEAEHDPGPRAATARWYALGDICHTVLNSAEFVYVD
ncbi:MAG: DUF1553 domain-containing protein [Bryobacteraceae bacterium]